MTSLADVRDVMRGVIASLFGHGGRLIARAILMVLAGRAFGIEAIGHLGKIAAITEIAAAISVLGLKRSLLDMLSFEAKHKRPPEKRILEALCITLMASLVISSILFFIWPLLYPHSHTVLPLLFLAVPAIVFTDVALTAIKYKRIIKWDVLARGIAEPWGFLLLALGFYMMGATTNGLIIAYAGSIFVGALCAGFGLIHTYGFNAFAHSKPRLSNLPALVKQSAPVGFTDVGNMMLRRIDLVVLSIFVGPAGAGLYYMVQQLATIPQKINTLFEPMMSPVIARLHNSTDTKGIGKHLVGVCRWVFIIQIGITIPMVVFGDALLGIFGPEFAVGGMVLAIILLAELIDGSFITAETPLVYARPKIPPFLLLIALIIEVMTIAILSKFWGVQGAALGFMFALISLTAGRFYMLKKHLGILIVGRSYILPLSFAVIITAGLLVVRYWFDPANSLSIILCIIAALAAYFFLIKNYALTKTDRILVRNLSKFKLKTARS